MKDQKPAAVPLNPQDNVAVALRGLVSGEPINPDGMACREEIPAGHKVALNEIHAGNPIRKYGQIIGFASRAIQPGDWVHTHYMEMGEAIFQLILETASGKKSKSELLGFGESEFVPWQIGPVM